MNALNVSILDEAVSALNGNNLRVVSCRPVYGGDINESYRLSLSDGSAVFMKCNTAKNLSFFEAEAKGLEALRGTETIGVPKVLGFGTEKRKNRSFLLLEYLEASPRIKGYWEVFGRELALLHRADGRKFLFPHEDDQRSLFSSVDGQKGFSANEDDQDLHFAGTGGQDSSEKVGGFRFGFESDNYIGASPQINTPKKSWIEFFRDCRLQPQIRIAEGYLDARMRRQCTELLDHLDSFLEEPEFPSLIHGDLWSGNAVCGPDGKAWILDPAAYVGHFEAELAMTELFGGFSPAFYGAYREINPYDQGYRDRRDLYNLYHMLNHLNLFGGSYLSAVREILNRYV